MKQGYNLHKDASRWLLSILTGMRRKVLTYCLCNCEKISESRLNLVPNLIAELVKLLK